MTSFVGTINSLIAHDSPSLIILVYVYNSATHSVFVGMYLVPEVAGGEPLIWRFLNKDHLAVLCDPRLQLPCFLHVSSLPFPSWARSLNVKKKSERALFSLTGFTIEVEECFSCGRRGQGPPQPIDCLHRHTFLSLICTITRTKLISNTKRIPTNIVKSVLLKRELRQRHFSRRFYCPTTQ